MGTKKKQAGFSIRGFRFTGVQAGIKKKKARDLALIYSEVPAVCVGTFTPHPAAAAPVILSKRHIKKGIAQAVVINSGNANACNGKQGIKDAEMMAERVAMNLQVPKRSVQVCSTGVIGVPLPIKKVLSGIDRAADELSPLALSHAVEAIMTTDNGPKVVAARSKIGSTPYSLISFAKGAGMIEPKMELALKAQSSKLKGKTLKDSFQPRKHATMLAFALTDLALDPKYAASVLQEAVDASFNRISVDGDMSTNDTCLLLANGLAGNSPLKASSRRARSFEKQLVSQLQSLAKMMVADGEGATKVIEIIIKGARNQNDAKTIAYAIANSQLVRTAFFGADPNWGRILCAIGNSGATCRPERVDISYGNVKVCRQGLDAGPQAEKKAVKVLKNKEVTLTVDLHLGQATHSILSSDLSLDYVTLNSAYRS